MAMWRIRRMEPAPEGTATIDCVAGEIATQVTLEDTDTRTLERVQLCINPLLDKCVPMHVLGATYTPNDWSEECP